jgi:hypothetical protein
VVDPVFTNPVYTMPLPLRLDGDYKIEYVSHPTLKDFQLTKEQRELQEKLNSAMLEEAGKMGLEEQQSRRRGFMKNQLDVNELRNNLMNNGANMQDVYKKAGMPGAGMMPAGGGMPPMMAPGMRQPGMGGMMPAGGGMAPMMPPGGGMRQPGMGGMMPAGGGMAPMMPPGGGMRQPGMGGMMPPGGMGMGMNGMGGQPMQPINEAAVGNLMLFRFLDFDVNPGEAYRYRVRLEFSNPNYGLSLDQVKEASVAEGESRMSDWSEPTAPIVIKPDTNFFLSKVDRRSTHKGEAEFHIVQWDPSLGTYIDSKKLVAKNGQFVGGLQESDRLDLGAQSLETKTVLFASKDFLVDTSSAPPINPAENPDLNLGNVGKQGLELPSEAIVLDEFGEIKTLDSASQKKEEKDVDTDLKKWREPYEFLREKEGEATNALDTAGAAPAGMSAMMPMMGPGSTTKRTKGSKATKGGTAGAAGAYGGGYGSAPSYPGGKGAGPGAGPMGPSSGYGRAPGYPGGGPANKKKR